MPEDFSPRPKFSPLLKYGLSSAFTLLVLYFLVNYLKDIKWQDVESSLGQLSPEVIGFSIALVALDYLILSSYDLLALHLLGKSLPFYQAFSTAFISYAMNMNLGALVGGLGFRLRMYAKWGLDAATIGKLVMTSVLTNWLGFALIAALSLLTMDTFYLDRFVSPALLKGIGFASLALPGLYLLLCAFKRHEVRLWRWTIELPSFSFALLQLSLSSLHWLLISGIIYSLFKQEEVLSYSQIVLSYVTAAIAGALAHVPAGLGVLEFVFIESFSMQLEKARVLALLLAFRALYYILPLLIALILFAAMELLRSKAKLK